MSFICDRCREPQLPGQQPLFIPIDTRRVEYQMREKGSRKRGSKTWKPDRGGLGHEMISKPEMVCRTCHDPTARRAQPQVLAKCDNCQKDRGNVKHNGFPMHVFCHVGCMHSFTQRNFGHSPSGNK